MSLEAETEAASETTSAETSAPESTSEYAATDPGYESVPESDGDDLAVLKAENTPAKKPSETSDDASEAKGDTEEPAEKPDNTADDSFSDELLDRATELGYTLDEIKEFRSEKSLEKDILRVEKLQKRLQERTGKTGTETETAEEAEPEPNWTELIEQGHDPDNIAILQKNWLRASKAEALVKQLYQAEQTRAFNAQCERFDETLNKLEGFEKLLGSGRKGELAKASPDQAANRQRVFTKMQVLRRGYEEAGEKVPAEADLIQEAVQASFYKHSQEIARKALTSQIKKAGSQALSRPHSSGGKPLSGQALATAKEQEFWKKHS